jgi:hypothetical protein
LAVSGADGLSGDPSPPTEFCRPRAIALLCHGVPSLLVAFFSGDETAVTVSTDGESVIVQVDGSSCELSRSDAAQLHGALGDALTEQREFFRTAGEYRTDGSYVVSRRGADSAGNAKVFQSFEELRRLYDRLPETFDADDVSRTGLTGSRRHMLIRHVCEHPAFDCEIERRSPLTATKVEQKSESEIDEPNQSPPAEMPSVAD